MNNLTLQEQLNEARRLRNNTSVKLCDAKRKGNDVKDLEKQLDIYRDQVNKLTALVKMEKESQLTMANQKPKSISERITSIPSQEKSIKAEMPKTWKKSELEKCERTLHKILEDNDWADDYQFRSSEWMFIRNIQTKIIKNAVELRFILQYKTKNHRVERPVTVAFNPNTVQSLNKYIERAEIWVMLNSGDLDNKEIPFGDRFNKVQFEQQGFPQRGWVIHK